ncbi:hypothetical protein [Streptomyces nitrosporeus]|uniref:hypothetical protein n=1 Tax=Streptomyces nitrosporeus TaxID=28894 RepID=UPI0039A24406
MSPIYAAVPNGGWTNSWSMTWWYNNCQQHIPAATNTVRVRTDILAYNMEQGVWWVCWSSPYQYNSAPDYEVGLNYNINRACGGDRWYANNTLAEAKSANGTWRGGWLVSGNTWVANLAAVSTKAPKPSLTVREALGRGEVRAGSPTGPTLGATYFRTGKPLPAEDLSELEAVPTKQTVRVAPRG